MIRNQKRKLKVAYNIKYIIKDKRKDSTNQTKKL